MPIADDCLTLWSWPWLALRWSGDLAETWLGAQRVVAARLPTIGQALADPLRADRRELGRMVSEKATAFGISGRAAASAGQAVRTAMALNLGAWNRLARGAPIRPRQWQRLAELNLAAMAAMASLPAAALAPIHDRVVANDRRLRR